MNAKAGGEKSREVKNKRLFLVGPGRVLFKTGNQWLLLPRLLASCTALEQPLGTSLDFQTNVSWVTVMVGFNAGSLTKTMNLLLRSY